MILPVLVLASSLLGMDASAAEAGVTQSDSGTLTSPGGSKKKPKKKGGKKGKKKGGKKGGK